MINKAALRILDGILHDIPAIGDDDLPFGSFEVYDITERNHRPHIHDTQIANFLIEGRFAVVIVEARFLARYEESRTLELTERGIKLRESGSYREFIGWPLYLLSTWFNVDVHKWDFKELRKTWLIALILAIVFGVLIAFIIEECK